MNEEELKEIWQADRTAPAIDFAAFRTTLSIWHDKLRRKIRIDIGVQFVGTAVVLAVVWFYPKLFFLFWASVALAAWYIWEILRLDRREKEPADARSVKQFLSDRLLAMKSFMRRARVVLYLLPTILIFAAYYLSGFFRDFSMTAWEWFVALMTPIAIGEILSVVLTELYFKFFYASAIKELKDLLRQLDAVE